MRLKGRVAMRGRIIGREGSIQRKTKNRREEMNRYQGLTSGSDPTDDKSITNCMQTRRLKNVVRSWKNQKNLGASISYLETGGHGG